jgi:hypothetical protein
MASINHGQEQSQQEETDAAMQYRDACKMKRQWQSFLPVKKTSTAEAPASVEQRFRSETRRPARLGSNGCEESQEGRSPAAIAGLLTGR